MGGALAGFEDFTRDISPGGAKDPFFGGQAGVAAGDAANLQAKYQEESLDYLKERERLPNAFRDAALKRTASQQGFTFDDQGNIIQDANYDPIAAAKQNPLYNAILGTREAGEQSILRNASATGGLRSGATIGQLTDYNQQLEQDALLQSYNQNQQQQNQLLGLPSNSNAIASGTDAIGQTLAQGGLAQVQANVQGKNQLLGLAAKGVGLLI